MVRSPCSGGPIQPVRRSKRIASSESSVSADETGSEGTSSARKKRLDIRTYRALLRNNATGRSQENKSSLEATSKEARGSILKSKLQPNGKEECNTANNQNSACKQLVFSTPEPGSSRNLSEEMPVETADQAVDPLKTIESNLRCGPVMSGKSGNSPGKESDNQLNAVSAEPSGQRATSDIKVESCFHGESIVHTNEDDCCPVPPLENDEDELFACSSEKDGPAKQCDLSGIEVLNDCKREEDKSPSPRNPCHISCADDEERGPNKSTDLVDIGAENRSVAGEACVTCQHPEPSLWCKGRGCKRGFHLSCIEPPLKETPSGIWYCESCIQKKIKFGPHSISQGIESVVDAHVVSVEASNGTEQEKQYLVKYDGLAHVHNRWVSEKEVTVNAPHLLLGKFHKKNQKQKDKHWKKEWTVPERLLQKRLVLPRNLADECFSSCDTTPCYFEWLVKWTFLGYEHATWELENSFFLCSTAGMALIKDFESRQIKGRKTLCSAIRNESRQGPILSQLPTFPEGSLGRADDDYLQSVNKLRESWHKGQNLILFDEQEKIIKIILFILSAEPDVSSPFLIVSGSNSMLLWQSEFKRLTPSLNIISYGGNKDGRKMARDLEFYAEDGSIKFHVLLSLPEYIVEDYDCLSIFLWEAFIVDDCQHFRVSKHLDQLAKLSSGFRLLLVDGQLQDNIGIYLSLISFLDSGQNKCDGKDDNENSNSGMSDLGFVKERLSQFASFYSNGHQTKFVEYWIPVELSTVQLEQMCSNLIFHSLVLRSSAKVDQVGALSDIILVQRKCCDHPYLVDDCLQPNLTKNLQAVENLNVGVKASGKLQLLDRILQEIRNRGLKTLLLFQFPGRDGKCSIGDILDDFLRQRFGEDSYERVDSGISSSRKQTSLNMFNDKEKGRFVLLIENRACLPSVRLSSIDVVIIFSGDWNPASDLKVLNKIHIDSPSGPIKVFRLYSLFTVEEKALVFAKENAFLDSDIRNVNCSISRSLVSWGASCIFNKLAEFHQNDNPAIGSANFFNKPILDQVLQELLTLISGDGSEKNGIGFSMISKYQQTSTRFYSKDMRLLGERESQCSSEESSHTFWSKLLGGANPKWKFVTHKSFRARKRPASFDLFLEKPELDPDPKKCKKNKNSVSDPETPRESIKTQACSLPVGHASNPGCAAQKSEITGKMKDKVASSSTLDVNVVDVKTVPQESSERRVEATAAESGERHMASKFQGNIHQLLKRDLPQLCQTFQLSPSVSEMARIILEYVIANHQISEGPETILQAFMISLCWYAAFILNERLDRGASLLLARKHLTYHCTDIEVESVYQKLQMIRDKSLLLDDFRSEMDKRQKLALDENPKKVGNEIKREESQLSSELEEGEILESPRSAPDRARSDLSLALLVDDYRKSRIKLIELVSSKRIDELRRIHEMEMDKLNGTWEIQASKMREAYKVKRVLIFAMNLPSKIQTEKLNAVERKFQNRMDKFEEHMEKQTKRLISVQVEAKNKEKRLKESWLAGIQAGNLPEPYEKIPLENSFFTLEDFEFADDVETQHSEDSDINEAILSTSNSEMLKNIEADPVTEKNIMPISVDARESSNAHRNILLATSESGQIVSSSNGDAVSRSCPDGLQQNPLTSGALSDAASSRVEKELGPHEKTLGNKLLLGVSGRREGLTLSPSIPPLLPSQELQKPSHNECSIPLVNTGQVIGVPLGMPSSGEGTTGKVSQFISAGGGVGIVSSFSSASGGIGTGTQVNLAGGGVGTVPQCSSDDGGIGTVPSISSAGGGIGAGTQVSFAGGGVGTVPQCSSDDGGIGTVPSISSAGGGIGAGTQVSLAGGGVGTVPQFSSAGGGVGTVPSICSAGGGIGTGTQVSLAGVGIGTGTQVSLAGVGSGTVPQFSSAGGGVGTVPQFSFSDLPPSTQASASSGAFVAVATMAVTGEMTSRENRPNAWLPHSAGHPHLMSSTARPHSSLQLELSKIQWEVEKETEMHEQEKHRLTSEMEKELEEIRKKYDSLMKDAELKHGERRKLLGMIQSKVCLNLVMAEEMCFKLSERIPLPSPQPATAHGSVVFQPIRPRQGPLVPSHLRVQASGAANNTVVPRPPLAGAQSFTSNSTAHAQALRLQPNSTRIPLPNVGRPTAMPAQAQAAHVPPSLRPQQQDEGLPGYWWQTAFPF